MEKEKENKKKVMVAIDESECSYYALMWVLDNLQELITKSTVVIFAKQPNPKICSSFVALGADSMWPSISPTMDLIRIAQQQNKMVSLSLLERAKKICASRGVKVEAITEVGDPKELICNLVKVYKINLLVLGYDEVGAFKRALMGNLSNYCVNNANCPVVVVKEPELH